MSVPSSRVAGEVLTVAPKDFQRVKAGDLLVQIDPAVYQAQVAQAEAGVAGAQAALDNLSNQVELQYATIAQAEAQLASAGSGGRGASGAGAPAIAVADRIRNAVEQATATYAKAQADVRASLAVMPRNAISSKCCREPRSSAPPISKAPSQSKFGQAISAVQPGPSEILKRKSCNLMIAATMLSPRPRPLVFRLLSER
jgi:multidrug efflux pump subunit AcrA (membrane-fusion protein)